MQAKRGFTLLELIIVLIISMLLITIGIPGFNTLIQNNRLSSTASNIQNQLSFARSQSISLINFVTICPLVNNNCTNNWINGLDIFIDHNKNKIYDSGDQLLKSGHKFNSADKLLFSQNQGITFAPDGHLNGSLRYFAIVVVIKPSV
ncbi:GspH/FimT family pseudopilin [Psychromonas sp. MME1]|uniref:GspH/FimT family pseudopilin n=1 Tax=Psychromonas sp. MME1 TaxID=3231032 RepID=UPI0034E28565